MVIKLNRRRWSIDGVSIPAANFTEQRLDFTSLVNLSSHSSYFFKSASNYPDFGILKGSLLAVDRAITFKHDQIVIANVGDNFILRRLRCDIWRGFRCRELMQWSC